MNLNIVILAAGMGKRMNSKLPKVLHQIGSKPILQHVLLVAKQLKPAKLIIVYGHGGELVKSTINNAYVGNNFIWVKQSEQLGTGHALKEALPYLDKTGATLILYGDVPFISFLTLERMLNKYEQNIVMLTMTIDNPAGYGRIVRDTYGEIMQIIEQNDADHTQQLIKEVNTGFYILPNRYLHSWIAQLSNANQQQEYYLTDIVQFAYLANIAIAWVAVENVYEALGVNNKLQLEELERFHQSHQATKLLELGVTLKDKLRIEIRGQVTAGSDCCIDVNCILEGKIVLGNNVTIGAGTILKNVTIYDGANIKPYSIIEDAIIGASCQIGPFARIRPGTDLQAAVHVGNFVEIKNSTIAQGSKVNHLTYIGDAEIGSGVNVGAGSVTCNYDGENKWKTIIKNNVFIGSGTMMVAPVVIGDNSFIGAGSTITKDVPENELTVARAKQTTILGWVKRNKKGD